MPTLEEEKAEFNKEIDAKIRLRDRANIKAHIKERDDRDAEIQELKDKGLWSWYKHLSDVPKKDPVIEIKKPKKTKKEIKLEELKQELEDIEEVDLNDLDL